MCDIQNNEIRSISGARTMPVAEAVGMVLAHDITEIRQDDFKGRAFKKGHIVREEDITYLQRLGKENLFVLNIADDEVHEDDAAYALTNALMGEGVKMNLQSLGMAVYVLIVRSAGIPYVRSGNRLKSFP